ncbi:DUF1330 domain-containing protein [Marinomonas piezotolerans]|uniref:DUF1330 domain-containing protein n=1 Tax=Marinomonas piezotolerans TaxID=2213058 RepID=A0A370UCP8_9GAMM|nr:DUF1330 domain-containing protein [Marinomonas piezotolerans]RDL45573.1 DUF1330 domain-containing protein [Marinomonas piezotolerans]
MKGYWIAHVEVQDADAYQNYLAKAPAALAAHGAKMLSRGENFTMLEGDHPTPTRAVVFEFDSYEAALACYHSDAYQQARAHRADCAKATVLILQGLPEA